MRNVKLISFVIVLAVAITLVDVVSVSLMNHKYREVCAASVFLTLLGLYFWALMKLKRPK